MKNISRRRFLIMSGKTVMAGIVASIAPLQWSIFSQVRQKFQSGHGSGKSGQRKNKFEILVKPLLRGELYCPHTLAG